MPYIKQEDRPKFETALSLVPKIKTAGELNYLLTRMVHKYITDNGFSYATVNDVVGVLECAKLELYRRRISPYEDKKIIENGDV